MLQSGGILAELLAVKFHTGVKAFKKAAPDLTEIATEHYVNKRINQLTL